MAFRQLIFFLSFMCVQSDCPEGWHTFQNSCFFINSNTRLSWADAASDCRSLLGGELAIVDSQDTLDFLFTKINPGHQKPPRGVCQIEADYWIDGTDQVIEGHWVWASNLQPLEGNYWCPGNPSNSGGHEDCLEFKDGHWNDDDCRKLQPFICEIEYPGDGNNIIG